MSTNLHCNKFSINGVAGVVNYDIAVVIVFLIKLALSLKRLLGFMISKIDVTLLDVTQWQ